MTINNNLLNEIFMYMKAKYFKSKDNILWKRFLYRDFNVEFNKDCYKKYKSIESFISNLDPYHLSKNKTLTQENI